MEIRTLASEERESLLDLLDSWELPDGWRGRDFFRRYVRDDPSFADENVWVGAHAGRLVSCVQIFPRRVRVRGAVVPLGGIGSVFTRPEERKSGIASEVLRAAVRAMRERGMLLSMLFAARIDWYESLGWRRWPAARALYVLERPAGAAPGLALEAFDAPRDLAGVAAIHADYGARRDGSLVRGEREWVASLRVAGNPGEDFRVARRAAGVAAYARRIRIQGHPILAEFGRRTDASDDLAALLVDLFADGGGAFGPAPADPELEDALPRRGVRVQPLADPSLMLRCLDAEAFAAATGLERRAGEADEELLRRALPPERLHFWPADRF